MYRGTQIEENPIIRIQSIHCYFSIVFARPFPSRVISCLLNVPRRTNNLSRQGLDIIHLHFPSFFLKEQASGPLPFCHSFSILPTPLAKLQSSMSLTSTGPCLLCPFLYLLVF